MTAPSAVDLAREGLGLEEGRTQGEWSADEMTDGALWIQCERNDSVTGIAEHIGANEADMAFIAFAANHWREMAEAAVRMEAELAEAYRALNLRTGLRNWETVIPSRIAAGVTEVRCDACGGSGTAPVHRWASFDDVIDPPCQPCGGRGRVMQALTAPLDKQGAKL